MLSILRLFLSLFLMLLHSSCKNPWNSFCLLRRMEATTLLHSFPASLHYRVLTNPDGKKCFRKLMTSEENSEEAIISPYFFIWQHILRDTGQVLTPISQQILSGECQGSTDVSRLLSPRGWDFCLNFFQTTSGLRVMFSGSLFIWLLVKKTKQNETETNLLFFLTTLFKKKITLTGHFLFLLCLYRVFININKFVYHKHVAILLI